MHPTVARVVDAAAAAGITAGVRDFPEGTRTAEDAARAVGCDVAAIVKTLVWIVDDEPVIAMVSGANRVDPAKLAAAAGGATARRADANEAREVTGFAVGGTPPFGHARPLRMFVDPPLLALPEVWVAAGTPTTVFSVEPGALAAATGAAAADIAADPS